MWKRKGLALFELLLVFLVIAISSVGMYSTFRKVSENARITNYKQQLMLLSSEGSDKGKTHHFKTSKRGVLSSTSEGLEIDEATRKELEKFWKEECGGTAIDLKNST